MKLYHPLISFDLEVTGLDLNDDRIVEIAAVKLMPDGTRISKVARLNPTIPISKGATAVHGISDDDVKDAPTFKAISRSLFKFLDGCDLTGYNIAKFDVPMLAAEFKRVGVEWPSIDAKVIDSFRIVMTQEQRTLSWALKHYTGQDLTDAHAAMADAEAALSVLLAQEKKFLVQPEPGPNEPVVTLDDMDLLQRDPSWVDSEGKFKRDGDNVVITFGKHQGTPLDKVPGSYLSWMLNQEFPLDAKEVIDEELRRRRVRRTG